MTIDDIAIIVFALLLVYGAVCFLYWCDGKFGGR